MTRWSISDFSYQRCIPLTTDLTLIQIIDKWRSEGGHDEDLQLLSEDSECVAAARIGSEDQVRVCCDRTLERLNLEDS